MPGASTKSAGTLLRSSMRSTNSKECVSAEAYARPRSTSSIRAAVARTWLPMVGSSRSTGPDTPKTATMAPNGSWMGAA